MFSRLSKVLAFVAALQILGGHWVALQSIAWVGMVIDYAKETSSLCVAIEKTFDGTHRCQLCEKVSKGRSDEQKGESMKLALKLEAILVVKLVVPEAAKGPMHFVPVVETVSTLAFPPPTPPPLA